MKEFKVKGKCQSCKGSGLYSGMGERNGSAVVCHNCKGTGCYEFTHKYEEFESRTEVEGDVKRVFQENPGICIGTGSGHDLENFGGMPYSDWIKGESFPDKSEMRRFVCPRWWYQSVKYDLKPNWDECGIGGAFSECNSFCNKSECWKRFDKENPTK